jgi:type IV pilus assembly protein PilV
MKPVPIHVQAHARARTRRRQGGIALLEAMLAIVILGIGLLGTIGLQARAYSALSDAGMRAEAAMAGEKLLGTMTADMPNLLSYSLASGGEPSDVLAAWVTETRSHIPNADLSVRLTPMVGRIKVNIDIRWQRKAKDEPGVHQVTSYIAI